MLPVAISEHCEVARLCPVERDVGEMHQHVPCEPLPVIVEAIRVGYASSLVAARR